LSQVLLVNIEKGEKEGREGRREGRGGVLTYRTKMDGWGKHWFVSRVNIHWWSQVSNWPAEICAYGMTFSSLILAAGQALQPSVTIPEPQLCSTQSL
jgi:hypothetical protein